MKTGAIGAPCHDDHNDIKNQKWSKIDVMGFDFARQNTSSPDVLGAVVDDARDEAVLHEDAPDGLPVGGLLS